VTSARGVLGLEEAAKITLGNISSARQRTERRLAERRALFAGIPIDDDATVVLTGSWGRCEVTESSDNDSIILLSGPRREDARPTEAQVAETFDGEPPGREAIFGKHVWLEDLQGKIGREPDSNKNLTRRMLFILESVSVCGADVHADARRALLGRYLSANVKDYRPPRFLLNDLIRYWRTIAVDFESKMRARDGEGWGLRNAKLRLSRKLLFAGGLLPVLECYRYRADEMLEFLDERVSVPPLDRLADAFLEHDAVDTGARVLTAYDEFLGILNDRAKRDELKTLGPSETADSELFAHIAGLGDEFENGLLSVLFDDPALQKWVRDYLIF